MLEKGGRFCSKSSETGRTIIIILSIFLLNFDRAIPTGLRPFDSHTNLMAGNSSNSAPFLYPHAKHA